MKQKIVISAGGSGGHLFPAQALAETLIEKGCDVLFLGSGLNDNLYFDRSRFSFVDVPSATIALKRPQKVPTALFRIMKGVAKSREALKRFRPEVVIGFGSFQTLPPLLAAKTMSVPILLHEANAVPGKVNRFFSPYAALTAITFPESKRYLKGKTALCTFPRRPSLKSPARNEALAAYGLSLDRVTLLIFGGSQGAKTVNELIYKALPNLSHLPIQVLHFTGSHADPDRFRRAYQAQKMPAVVKPFESDMPFAWTAADLVISRAGAGSIAEQKAFAVPGILIPYPYAADDHQTKNARSFIRETDGAVLFQEKTLTSEILAKKIEELVTDETLRLHMKRSMIKAQSPKHLSLGSVVLGLELPSNFLPSGSYLFDV